MTPPGVVLDVDVKAAAGAGLPTLAVLTGGLRAHELREAGAVEVFEDLEELMAQASKTPLSG